MSLITRMRKQNAIYWPPATADDYGRVAVGTLVELTLTGGVNSRVRWEDQAKEFIDSNGITRVSQAVVYVPALPGGGGEVAVGGFLWLGDRGDLESETDPGANEGAWEVRRFDKLPNLKNTEYLRTAYL